MATTITETKTEAVEEVNQLAQRFPWTHVCAIILLSDSFEDLLCFLGLATEHANRINR